MRRGLRLIVDHSNRERAQADFPSGSVATSASRRRDVPNATSGGPVPTSNPNDGDGCAYGDAAVPP
jgi:hypothetical protein